MSGIPYSGVRDNSMGDSMVNMRLSFLFLLVCMPTSPAAPIFFKEEPTVGVTAGVCCAPGVLHKRISVLPAPLEGPLDIRGITIDVGGTYFFIPNDTFTFYEDRGAALRAALEGITDEVRERFAGCHADCDGDVTLRARTFCELISFALDGVPLGMSEETMNLILGMVGDRPAKANRFLTHMNRPYHIAMGMARMMGLMTIVDQVEAYLDSQDLFLLPVSDDHHNVGIRTARDIIKTGKITEPTVARPVFAAVVSGEESERRRLLGDFFSVCPPRLCRRILKQLAGDLDSDYTKVRYQAALNFKRIAQEGGRCAHRAMFDEDIISSLIAVLSGDEQWVIFSARFAVYWLVMYGEKRMKASILARLSAILNDKDSLARSQAAGILSGLAEHGGESVRRCLVAPLVLSALVGAARGALDIPFSARDYWDKDNTIQAVQALCFLADPLSRPYGRLVLDVQANLLAAGVVSVLSFGLFDKNEKISEECFHALYMLARCDDSRVERIFSESGLAIKGFSAIMNIDFPGYASPQEAADILTVLAEKGCKDAGDALVLGAESADVRVRLVVVKALHRNTNRNTKWNNHSGYKGLFDQEWFRCILYGAFEDTNEEVRENAMNIKRGFLSSAYKVRCRQLAEQQK